MPTLLDTHHHLDFLPSPELRAAVVAALAERGVRLVAQTLTPSGFRALVDGPDAELSPAESAPLWSLGFHPWHLGDKDAVERELATFAEGVRRTRFVGEIGLDFSPRRLETASAERQVEVLERILRMVTDAARDAPADRPYVLSLHAVRSADAVLDVLRRAGVDGSSVVPVFHRFAGTSDELTALVRLGGCLSVHPQLLSSKRGRAYVRQVPADRLLLETDLPDAPVPPPALADIEGVVRTHADAVLASLADTVRALEELRGDGVLATLRTSQTRLYGVR